MKSHQFATCPAGHVCAVWLDVASQVQNALAFLSLPKPALHLFALCWLPVFDRSQGCSAVSIFRKSLGGWDPVFIQGFTFWSHLSQGSVFLTSCVYTG